MQNEHHKKVLTREGIEPPTFRSGVERATIAPPRHVSSAVLGWSIKPCGFSQDKQASENLRPDLAGYRRVGCSRRYRRPRPFSTAPRTPSLTPRTVSHPLVGCAMVVRSRVIVHNSKRLVRTPVGVSGTVLTVQLTRSRHPLRLLDRRKHSGGPGCCANQDFVLLMGTCTGGR